MVPGIFVLLLAEHFSSKSKPALLSKFFFRECTQVFSLDHKYSPYAKNINVTFERAKENSGWRREGSRGDDGRVVSLAAEVLISRGAHEASRRDTCSQQDPGQAVRGP